MSDTTEYEKGSAPYLTPAAIHILYSSNTVIQCMSNTREYEKGSASYLTPAAVYTVVAIQ